MTRAMAGVHINDLVPEALAFLRECRPGLVKTLDHGHNWGGIKSECGIEFLLGRLYLDRVANLEPTPEAAAERLFEIMLPMMRAQRGVYNAWETPWNERYQRVNERLVDYARATKRFCELAHSEGIPIAVGNFSVGNPEPWELADAYAEGLEKADYLSVHEYWLPGRFEWQWWCGRHKRLAEALPTDLRRPILITECGIDGGLEKPPRDFHGWRRYEGYNAENYADELESYRRELDPAVIGTAVYCCGVRDERWRSFDIADHPAIAGWMREYRTVWQVGDPHPDTLSGMERGDLARDGAPAVPGGESGLAEAEYAGAVGNPAVVAAVGGDGKEESQWDDSPALLGGVMGQSQGKGMGEATRVMPTEPVVLRDLLLWDPRPEAIRYPWRGLGQIERIVIHHSGVDADSSAESIRNYHTRVLGWPGIGYHFVIHWDGRIEYAMHINRASYHIAGRNPSSLGICIPGNWSLRRPPEAALTSCRRLILGLWAELGRAVPVGGHRDYALSGHGTECPGSTWPEWRADVDPGVALAVG